MKVIRVFYDPLCISDVKSEKPNSDVQISPFGMLTKCNECRSALSRLVGPCADHMVMTTTIQSKIA